MYLLDFIFNLIDDVKEFFRKKEKVYISGAVTDNPFYEHDFYRVERTLKVFGYKPCNPIKGEKEGKKWAYYLKKDIKKLIECDSVYLLQNWEISKGARLEKHIAEELGMTVYKRIGMNGLEK